MQENRIINLPNPVTGSEPVTNSMPTVTILVVVMEHKDQKGTQERKDQKGTQEHRGYVVCLLVLGPRVAVGVLEVMVVLGHVGLRVTAGVLVHRVHVVYLEVMVHRVHVVCLAVLDHVVCLVVLERVGPRVIVGVLKVMVHRVHVVCLEVLGHVVPRVIVGVMVVLGCVGPRVTVVARPGPRGPAGSGGLSASGFTMQGNIDMGNNKITNLPDPTLANDPVTKQYATRVYLTDGGFTMQDNIGMNNHEVLGLNPSPLDGTAAVSKDFTDSKYVEKNADIDMDNNRILDLPFPQSLGEPVTKTYADMHYFDFVNILTFKGKPNTCTVTHIDDMVDTPFNGRSNNILDFSKVGGSYQINFGVTPKLVDGIYAYEMDVVLTMSRGYNIMLWGDCGGSGYKAWTKCKYWSWSLENKVAQNDAQGGYFHRATGKRVHVKGSFLNLGTRIYGQEISLSLDCEGGKTYEFVMQSLKSQNSDHILGNSISFVF